METVLRDVAQGVNSLWGGALDCELNNGYHIKLRLKLRPDDGSRNEKGENWTPSPINPGVRRLGMSELLRPTRPIGTGRHMVLFFAVIGGIVAGVLIGKMSDGSAEFLATLGRVFVAAAVVVSVPLVASQLALALNNPRERARRGVSQAKILVRSLIGTIVLVIISVILAGVLSSEEGSSSLSSVLNRINPEKFMAFGPDSGILPVLMLAVVASVLLGALGFRATGAVTFFNRVSRASVRSFRLLLWLAPFGLLGLTAGIVSGGTTFKVAFGIETATPIILTIFVATTGYMIYSSVVLGVDWMVGQLRPKRKDRPVFDRGRAPQRGPRPGYQTTGAPRATGRDRQGPPRRFEPRTSEKERSPFDMGVSSTPVLDIETGQPKAAPRPAVSTESSSEEPGGQRRYRDRDGRPDSRDERRDRGPRDRGPRGRRDDRFRGDRPDRQGGRYRQGRPQDGARADIPVSDAQEPESPAVDRAAIQSELARVSEHLGRMNNVPAVEPVARPVVTESNKPAPSAVQYESAVPESVQPSGGDEEMHYGRSRHRKHEHAAATGVTPPEPGGTVPESVDHFSTEDMSFGRGKRRKTPK